METIQPPKTRHAEIIRLFIEKRNFYFSHYDFANKLHNINSHKTISLAKSLGLEFDEIEMPFKNRFGRKTSFKKFRLKTKENKAIDIYNKFNS